MIRNAILSLFCLSTLMVFCTGLSFAQEDNKKPVKIENNTTKISALIEKLGHDSFDIREDAAEALKKYGEEARPLLEKALESEDLEVRLRALKLIGYLDGRKDSLQKSKKGKAKGPILLRRRPKDRMKTRGFDNEFFNELFDFNIFIDEGSMQDIFDSFIKDRPSFRFHLFGDDPLKPIDQLMKEFKKDGSSFNLRMGGNKTYYQMERLEGGEREELNLSIQPDGSVEAKICITDKDGKKTENVYKAKNMEAFKKNCPKAAEKFNLNRLGIFTFRTDQFRNDLSPLTRKQRPDNATPRIRLTERIGKGRTLGVYIDPEGLGPVLRAHLGLDKEEGLLIERVMKDSFADKIGVKAMDIIVNVDEKPIRSTSDIKSSLSSIENGDEVKVIVFRKGKKVTLSGKYNTMIGGKKM